MPTAAERVMLGAARIAVARAARLRPVVGYLRDDAMQDACIGAWLAQRGSAPDADDEQALSLLALAGYRNILDGRRHRYAVSAGGARERDLADAPEPEQPGAAHELIAVAQALRAIGRLREPLPEIARLLIEGHEPAAIAAHMHVSAAMVSRYRRALQATVSKYIAGAPA